MRMFVSNVQAYLLEKGHTEDTIKNFPSRELLYPSAADMVQAGFEASEPEQELPDLVSNQPD